MPEGTPFEETERALLKMQEGLDILAQQIRDDGYGEAFDNVVFSVGAQNFEGGGPTGEGSGQSGSNLGELQLNYLNEKI